MSLLSTLLAESAQPAGGLFLPVQASTAAPGIDYLMWFINGVAIFFTLLIFVLTIWFTFKYHHSKHPHAERTGHNNALELTWTAIPTLIVFIMFFWGFFVYMGFTAPAKEATANAYEIRVEGYAWGWNYYYRHPDTGAEVMIPGQPTPGKADEGEGLYLPVNVPVRLVLSSKDVIHSYYIPAFRMKKDVVPGRFNKMAFEPTMTGKFDVFCTEYCGDRHSKMLSVAYVDTIDKVNDAIRKFGDPTKGGTRTPEETGLVWAGQSGCFTCHAEEGKKANIGPAWTDAIKHQQLIAPNMSFEDYIRESIVNPGAKIVPGYGNQMAPYRFNDKELGWLIAYIKSINGLGPAAGSPAPKPAGPEAGAPATAPATAPTR
jgi:cytochrome c oxidase subunit 2